jgi:large subunit ribosomal protein L6
MSKIGKQELTIPSGVTVTVNGNVVSVKGKGGELVKAFDSNVVKVNIDGTKVTVAKIGNGKFASQLWGTMASHIKNMIKGVDTPFAKKLLIEGVGYKWDVKGTDLNLALGFSHPVLVKIPAGLTVKADKGQLDITGIDKEMVASFAMRIRKMKLPEPYKGKGIRYSDEVIRRKQGKRSA